MRHWRNGWALILALTISGSAVAAEAQPTAAQSFLSGQSLGADLARQSNTGNAASCAPKAYQAGAALGAGLRKEEVVQATAGQPARASTEGKAVGSALMHKSQQAIEANQNALIQAIADSEVKNGKDFLSDTRNGMPVLPPGMTVKEASRYISHDWAKKREKTATVFVLISLGMPDAVLRNLFEQVQASPVLRDNTVFMLRGWSNQPMGFQETVQHTQNLQPQGPYRSPVMIDPNWFEALHVHQVPAVVIANTAHNGVIYGEGLSILDARQRIDQGRDLGKTFGKTWKIAEPDALVLLKEAAKKVDLAKYQQHAQKGIWQELSARAPALPEVDQSQTTIFDPSVVATRNITLPDGRVVVKAGQRINPLAQAMPWQTLRFIIFDANQPWQVKQAQSWQKQYPGSRILMAGAPSTQQGWTQIEHDFQGTPVRLLEPFVASRLGVTATPAMVWPQDRRLHVLVQGRPVKEH